jgi:hypothetical protein
MDGQQTDACLLEHKGELTLQDSEALFETMRGYVSAGIVSRGAMRVFVEMVQNLRLHGGANGGVRVIRFPGALFIETENTTSLGNARHVVRTVFAANASLGGIRELIHKKREEPAQPGSCGAGLGFLEIRRHCSDDIEVIAEPLGDGNYELVIRAVLTQ